MRTMQSEQERRAACPSLPFRQGRGFKDIIKTETGVKISTQSARRVLHATPSNEPRVCRALGQDQQASQNSCTTPATWGKRSPAAPHGAQQECSPLSPSSCSGGCCTRRSADPRPHCPPVLCWVRADSEQRQLVGIERRHLPAALAKSSFRRQDKQNYSTREGGEGGGESEDRRVGRRVNNHGEP